MVKCSWVYMNGDEVFHQLFATGGHTLFSVERNLDSFAENKAL